MRTTFAQLLFPEGSDTSLWYVHDDVNYGIVEFQAFANPLQIPEPSTWALLALGAVALLGYRRRA